jgi:hypothetical protein
MYCINAEYKDSLILHTQAGAGAFFVACRFLKFGGDRYFVHSFALHLVKIESKPGLPDFSWYMIPKPEKRTKWIQNVPNGKKYPKSP